MWEVVEYKQVSTWSSVWRIQAVLDDSSGEVCALGWLTHKVGNISGTLEAGCIVYFHEQEHAETVCAALNNANTIAGS